MQLTTEQKAILSTNHNLVINAVAGSGKTTTLIEYAKTRPPGSKILYLAFNKTVKTEAIQKFAAKGVNNVKVETAHSLAFDHIVKHSKYNLVQGYTSFELCDILKINTPDKLTNFIIANHVNKFISYFCNSNVQKVQELNYAEIITDPKATLFVNNFYKSIEQYTREALAKMNSGSISITHDFYLKIFQLSNPVLNYNYILFDEGQDASAAMLDVFLKQNGIKIIVGDMHQQIYGWRYAINSLQKVDYPIYNLSNSFRFDDEIALIANKVLAYKKELKLPNAVKVIGCGTTIEKPQITRATIGRTNLNLLINAIAQWQHGDIRNVFFEGNINSYSFADEGASLYDVLNLYNGKKDKIKDKLIASMKTMAELEEYIEKTEDTSLSLIVEVVKEFGNNLPNLIAELKNNHTTTKEEADMIFSTVHRCKGMEYDEVTLLNDFINIDKLAKSISQYGGDAMNELDRNKISEEINILYVAATRAKNKLTIPPEINPLQSLQLVEQPKASISKGNSYQKYNYETRSSGEYSKNTNHGKPWTYEDEEKIEKMFEAGKSFKEIAKAVGRGQKGVEMKLMNLGMIDDLDLYDLDIPF